MNTAKVLIYKELNEYHQSLTYKEPYEYWSSSDMT